MLRSVSRWFITDVSGKHIGLILKDQDVQEEFMSKNNSSSASCFWRLGRYALPKRLYQTTHWRRTNSQVGRGESQKSHEVLIPANLNKSVAKAKNLTKSLFLLISTSPWRKPKISRSPYSCSSQLGHGESQKSHEVLIPAHLNKSVAKAKNLTKSLFLFISTKPWRKPKISRSPYSCSSQLGRGESQKSHLVLIPALFGPAIRICAPTGNTVLLINMFVCDSRTENIGPAVWTILLVVFS